jgi:hypothetical protein
MRTGPGYEVSFTQAWNGRYDVDLSLKFLGAEAHGHAAVSETANDLNRIRPARMLRPFKGSFAACIHNYGAKFFRAAA